MKLFIVDDNKQFIESVTLFIEGYLHYEVVGKAHSGKEFLNNYNGMADIVLMDINMPVLDGLKATKHGIWMDNELKIIAVSQYSSIVDLNQLISAGFKGFVSKTNIFSKLNNALKTVNSGKLFFPDQLKVRH